MPNPPTADLRFVACALALAVAARAAIGTPPDLTNRPPPVPPPAGGNAPAGGAAAKDAGAPARDGEFAVVGFDRLAGFDYTPPDYTADGQPIPAKKGADQIPAEIRQLHQRKVAVTGYMVPVKMEGNLVREFMLVSSPMLCCYGVMPRVNEWIIVRMAARGVPPLQDVPLTLYGRLQVGETFENGYLVGLYQLEGERSAAK